MFGSLSIGLAALAIASQPATGTPGGSDGQPSALPVMLTMVQPSAIEGAPLRQPSGEGHLCATGYGDCLRVVRGDDGTFTLAVFDMDAAASTIDPIAIPAQFAATSDPSDERQTLRIWDRSIRLPNGEAGSGDMRIYLIGLIRTVAVSYSGGGAGADRIHLFRLTLSDGSAELGPELLSLPLTAQVLIRACFAEEDGARRRGACHDEYDYGATLALAADDDRSGLLPQLVYTTQATAYPQTARRGEDSSAAPPLRTSDLSRWRDPECSYIRRLFYNPASERYEMERPAPDCSAYTVP